VTGKIVIIARDFRTGHNLALNKCRIAAQNFYDGTVTVAYKADHLRGRDLRGATVYMPTDWGLRNTDMELAMELERVAKSRGARITWV
jgi:hypothetical protein